MANDKSKSLIERLRSGEKIQCPCCKKGYFTTSAEDISISHGFSCEICGAAINVDPFIDLE